MIPLMPRFYNGFFTQTYLINVTNVKGLDTLHKLVESKDHRCKVESIQMLVGSILEQKNGE